MTAALRKSKPVEAVAEDVRYRGWLWFSKRLNTSSRIVKLTSNQPRAHT
jgi:hypothetical protein